MRVGIWVRGGVDSDIYAELGFQSKSSDMINFLPISRTVPGTIWVPLLTRVPRSPQVFNHSEAEILLFVPRMGSLNVSIRLLTPF